MSTTSSSANPTRDRLHSTREVLKIVRTQSVFMEPKQMSSRQLSISTDVDFGVAACYISHMTLNDELHACCLKRLNVGKALFLDGVDFGGCLCTAVEVVAMPREVAVLTKALPFCVGHGFDLHRLKKPRVDSLLPASVHRVPVCFARPPSCAQPSSLFSLCFICIMASSRSQNGIQLLLAAEQEAQHIVNAARTAKQARLKQAKEEAEKEVAEFRAQVEADFQRKLAESSGDTGANVKRLEQETEEKIKHIKTKASRISPDVVSMLLRQVTTVKN
ncbi:v-type proton ATPase subunit G [Striga asiatica]|uniref:V-type proton ATPase subunit G n=1 Tax=Striga asiatica TaxID=4170 RepID=A0A5A7R4D5_STRAF|nr:v-type proton ATPase subunit G [Striga asiatica]